MEQREGLAHGAHRYLRRHVLPGAAALAMLPLMSRSVAATSGFEWRPWPAGRAVPPFDLPRLEGGRFTLRQHLGKVVLLNFWATWCVPCRDEMPSLVRFVQAHASRGLVLGAVNYRESPAAIRRFTASLPEAVPVLLDESGDAAKAWTPRIFPTTVLIGRRGRPAGLLVGEVDWESTVPGQWVGPLLDSA
jgi:thiol-disulfide isomerase/thioredoxin